MKTFTGWQYLLIDVANHYGLDKLTFEERIDWAERHLDDLETYEGTADARPLFLKACMAIRRAQNLEPVGHLVAFDAVCSGIQIMSSLTGCESGARATGMVDPDRRADAYTEVTDVMNVRLASEGLSSVSFPRNEVKYAVMTSCYGSKAVPKRMFGEDTPELSAFYAGCFEVAPGAFTLLDELLNTWQPYALSHEWVLPDNFHAKVKVMTVVEKEGIEIDELDHTTFTYQYRVNQGQETGLSNVANVVHSIDAYVLRELLRRCNYNVESIEEARGLIGREILIRYLETSPNPASPADDELAIYLRRWERTGMASLVILPYLDPSDLSPVSTEHLQALFSILEEMMVRRPCDVITIHDSFAAHPNHVDTVRYWYKELMAELADSNLLSDLFTQLLGVRGSYHKMTPNLGDKIRKSNYALS